MIMTSISSSDGRGRSEMNSVGEVLGILFLAGCTATLVYILLVALGIV
jgi:hypothetical protein